MTAHTARHRPASPYLPLRWFLIAAAGMLLPPLMRRASCNAHHLPTATGGRYLRCIVDYAFCSSSL